MKATLLCIVVSIITLSGCASNPTPHLPSSTINAGDTAFLLVSAALVMLMTPALGLFYGGLVRSKNVLSNIMSCLASLAVVTVLWICFGYSLAFSPSMIHVGKYGFLGGFHWAFLPVDEVGLSPHPFYCPTLPHQLFMVYQCMFAVITPALISGAVAERIKFSTFLVFSAVWSIVVYCPVAHWVWSEHGWLREIGALDFAGGTVVHVSSGFTALLMAVVLKPRRGFLREAFVPHNIVYCALGAGLLWFGWFGFNAGSAIGSGQIAVIAFVSTHSAAAAGALAWMFYDLVLRGKPTALGTASGAVAGLVSITPAAGYVGPLPAILMGAAAGVVCAWAVSWRARKGIDDALDAFGIHGVGGALGAILTGIFASHALNPAVPLSSQGLIHGGLRLPLVQITGLAVTIIYCVATSWVILTILDCVMGLRVSAEDEQIGLDLTQHGESAYNS